MRLAILGGGQLAWMLALAAEPLGIDVAVLDPSPDCAAGRIADRFEDRDEIADRHTLAQQALQHAVERGQRHLARNEIVHERRVGLPDRIHHLLDILTAEQLGGVGLEGLHEVRGDHRRGLDDDVAHGLRIAAARRRDPTRRHAEARVSRFESVDHVDHRAGVEREEVARHDLAAGDFTAAEANHVLARRESDVVTDADGRDQNAELHRGLLAQQADALEEIAAL